MFTPFYLLQRTDRKKYEARWETDAGYILAQKVRNWMLSGEPMVFFFPLRQSVPPSPRPITPKVRRNAAHELGTLTQTGLRHRHRHCPNCGGSLKIIAAIEDPPVIIKILTHLGLSTRAPPRAPAQRFDLFQTT